MKICVISPGVVHAVPRTVAIADRFDEVHFIDVIGSADRKMLESHGIIYHGPVDTGNLIIKNRQLQSLFRKIEPDAIVCHYAAGDHFFNAIAYGRCPVAAIAMGHDILYERGHAHIPHLLRLLIRMGLRRLDYISAKSVYLSDRIRGFGVTCAVDVNYWGADLDRFKSGDRFLARKRLGLQKHGPIILSPRTMDPCHNIYLIVEAFQGISEAYPDASLIILGRSMDAYRKQVEELVSKCNLSNKVRFVGEVGQEVLPDYYNASDVVVSMAKSEGFPNTLLEVMGCEVPVVVGDIPQIRELLTNGRNARICNISRDDMVATVLDVLNNPAEAARMAANGRITVDEFANIAKNGKKFSNRINQLGVDYRRPLIFSRIVFLQLYNFYKLLRRLPI